jgi:hypothetical protein
MVKNLILGLLGAVTLFTGINTCAPVETPVSGQISLNRAYSRTMLVTDVRDLNDGTYLLTMEDCNGFIWEYETDGDDYFIDDCVSVIMDNMETPLIWDDEIVSVNYNAWNLSHFN